MSHAALLRPARDADRAAALDLRDLAATLPDRAGGAGDDDGLPGLRPPDLDQSEVGRQPADAERPEVDRRRRRATLSTEITPPPSETA